MKRPLYGARRPAPASTGQKSIYVFGPQGCGKTRNAKRLAAYFGLKHWRDVDYVDHRAPKTDHLLLGNEEPPAEMRRAIRYADAMAMMESGKPFSYKDFPVYSDSREAA